MQIYHLLDLNLFLFLLLLMIVRFIHTKQSYRSYSTRLFLLLCWGTMLLLILDASVWILDGIPGERNYWLVYLTNFVFYLFEPIPLIIWLCYLDYQLNGSIERLRKRWYYIFPFIVSAVLMLYSLFTDFIFYIDNNNTYHRGPGVFLIAFLYYLIILYSFYLVLRRSHNVEKRVIKTIVLFGIIPVIATVFQLVFLGISLIWPSVALAVIYVYIFLETQREIRDYLTGLLNRQQIDDFIQTRIMDYGKKGSFALIMLDMDEFKDINDIYGHKEGDRALIQVAAILTRSVKRIDKVARFGGDEFLILVEDSSASELSAIIDRIQNSLEEENNNNERPYKISISAGYSIYSPKEHHSFNYLLNNVDQNMYKAKRARKKVNYAQIS